MKTQDTNEAETGGRILVENPATNEIIGSVLSCDRMEVDEMISAADRAFPGWKRRQERERREILHRLAGLLDSHGEELALILVREVGKPLAEARHEVISAAGVFRTYAEMPLGDTVIRDDSGSRISVTRKPLGVAALILPWNYPLAVLAWKLAPALLTGNTVILKPSPYAPLNTVRFLELAGPGGQGVLPEGVVQVATGGDRTGEWLVRSHDVRKIAFTGHIDTGRKILSATYGADMDPSDRIKRVSLELGGNDPAIVLDDFDLSQTPRLFWSSFRNAGQICVAVKRVYVHESIHSAFLERYVRIAQEVKVGNGMEEGVEMGPVNNPGQLALIEGLVSEISGMSEMGSYLDSDGVRGDGGNTDTRGSGGGRILTGGQRLPGPGYFYPPTVITDVDESSRVVHEEQFGPVIPIMSYSDIEEAVERANSLRYGLGASVWTRDIHRGLRVARQLESGTIWVNTHMVVDPSAPFGGIKGSGIGRELGMWGLDEYVDLVTIHLKR